MNYFVTGGTGFIGTFLIDNLLARGGTVYALVRESSQHKLEELKSRNPDAADRLIGVTGDLAEPLLGVSQKDIDAMKGQIDHFFHVAALYDLSASADDQYVANIDGTRNAVACAEALEAGVFQHTSSIVAGGNYKGTFRENMFEEAGDLSNPYPRTKHDSEGVVRNECNTIPWRIYRPSGVVGHSQTGEIDKIDGPYFSFRLLKKLRDTLPPWFPLATIDMGSINLVPVDYVADAMAHIAHREGLDGGCFHLTNPDQYSFGELLNIFADAGGAPRMAMRFDSNILKFIPAGVLSTVANLPPVKRIVSSITDSLGIPEGMTDVLWETRYDDRETERALEGSGIKVPKLPSYADKLWDYWLRNLDPDLFVDRSLRGNVQDKVVIVTGAGTGLGEATAIRLAEAGARVIITGRTLETLESTRQQIEEAGGVCHVYTCDISDYESCDAFTQQVLSDFGHVDILINNAGRSIRRAVEHSFDRFHDAERTMQLNYFGCLRLIYGLLPSMSERRSGHIINISSMGAIAPAARFSVYAASKSALEGWTRCAEAEFSDQNIHFTTVNMALVRTPMIAPTKAYDYAPALSPAEAAEMIVEAIVDKPSRVVDTMGRMLIYAGAIAPKLLALVMNTSFRMFGESNAAKGIAKPESVEPSSEQVAMANLMKGVHF